MSPKSEHNAPASEGRLQRFIRLTLVVSLLSGVIFLAAVAFKTLIPAIFYADVEEGAFGECPESPSVACPPTRCADGLILLRDRLLAYSSEHTNELARAMQITNRDDWFATWDNDFRSLEPQCTGQQLDGYRALSQFRHLVDTDLKRMDERYLPLMARMPQGPPASER